MNDLRTFLRARAREHWNVRHACALDNLVELAGTGVVDTQMLRWLAYPYFDHPDYRREWLPQ